MDHLVKVFESSAAMELAKHHMRASRLKWHGTKQTWLVEFLYTCPQEMAKVAAQGYLIDLYHATEIEFWKRADNDVSGEFYATFVMEKVDLEGYYIAET